ncbi:signal peptidase I [Arthrobacter sp. MYb227]|uniref:signal peptidase I n=1 Tax=Arthrobacter sp. MYb227 TaxID=1848601 RepID=UPI002157C5B8|nr:signal peptidase I [Arthrobacter sp. MYb227]
MLNIESMRHGSTTNQLGAEPRVHMRRSPLKLMFTLLGWILVGALVALLLGSSVLPRVIGAVPLAVLSGSMEPRFSAGDLVISQPVDPAQISIGDIVTFQPEANNPALVTHRVVSKFVGEGGAIGFTTRGDANGVDDEPIIGAQVRGKVLYTLPWVGHVVNALNPKLRTGLLQGAGALLLVGAVVSLARPAKKSRTNNPLTGEQK